MDDWIHAALKEWYWGVILAALVAVAFAPSFLKAKCPGCGKKALRSIDVEEHVLAALSKEVKRPFLTFFACDRCGARYVRERTGPFQDASVDAYEAVYQPRQSSI